MSSSFALTLFSPIVFLPFLANFQSLTLFMDFVCLRYVPSRERLLCRFMYISHAVCVSYIFYFFHLLFLFVFFAVVFCCEVFFCLSSTLLLSFCFFFIRFGLRVRVCVAPPTSKPGTDDDLIVYKLCVYVSAAAAGPSRMGCFFLSLSDTFCFCRRKMTICTAPQFGVLCCFRDADEIGRGLHASAD